MAHRHFLGQGSTYALVCEACGRDPQPTSYVNVCETCDSDLQTFWVEGRNIGHPEPRVRREDLAFQHAFVQIPEAPADQFLAFEPIRGARQSVWLGLTRTGDLCVVNVEDRTSSHVIALAFDYDPDKPVILRVEDQGRFAVAANTYAQRGVVVDLRAGQVTMELDRGDYHISHCIFPLAFVTQPSGECLLVHATDWNRLQVSNPETGAAKVERTVPQFSEQGGFDPHYLDYFHSGLLISPGGNWIADNGWIWHPYGLVVAWSLTDWLSKNVWESEDGPTRQELCSRESYWNGPICWIDDTTLAVWGVGDTEDNLLPAVRLFDVTTGLQKAWFPGPQGTLVFDGWLFSFAEGVGMAIWDMETRERVHDDPSFVPYAYHPGAKHFLSLLPDGSFRISTLRPSNTSGS